jgi:hypothetical protein
LAEAEKKKGFWTTLPGILTGVAALLTALTGLLVVMYPHGVGESKESPGTAVGAGVESPKPATEGRSSAPAAGATQGKQKPTVLVVGKDGTETRVFRNSFRDSYSGEAIQLKNGQSIPFDKVKSIDFLDVHEYERDLRVTLTDGRVVEGAIMSGEQITGDTDIGPFSISVKSLKQIVF